jgi:alpha-ketoglutarate-dependent 2,4-dichlorophenoxyacetate dioxygenase
LNKLELRLQSLLLAHEVPPQNVYGQIGNTEFADSRTAYADLPEETKDKIKDSVVDHTQLHSRRRGAPNEPLVWEDRVSPVF